MTPSYSNATRSQHHPTQPYRVAEPRPLVTPEQRASSQSIHLRSPVRRTQPHTYAEAAQRAPPRSREINQGKGRRDMRREQTSGTLNDWRQDDMDYYTQGIPSIRQNTPPGTQHAYNPHNNRSNGYGCYNCGEYNHRQVSCRFDHRLRCGLCRRVGHKQKLCRNNSYTE